MIDFVRTHILGIVGFAVTAALIAYGRYKIRREKKNGTG